MSAPLRIAWLAALPLVLSDAGAETLTDAWRLAEGGDLSLAAARSDAEAARHATSAARGERLPSLALTGSAVQLQDAPAFDFSPSGLPVQLPEIFGSDNFVMGGARLAIPLYTSGRITHQVRAAEAGEQARDAEAAHALRELRLKVAEHYVAVLRARQALAVADGNVASLADHVRDVTAMFNRETVPRNDLLSAQVALANAEQARLQARNAVELARAAYNRQLGQPLDRTVDLEPLATAVPIPGEADIAALEARALANRRELAALEAQGTSLGHAARAERARRLPQVMLTGGYQYLENQVFDREEFAMAGIDLAWSLFDGGRTRHRAAALERSQQAVTQRLQDYRSRIALEVRQAWLTMQETQARVAVTATAVEQGEENLRIARQQYAAGLANSTRVLEAEALRTLSRSNRENALLDAELARIRLARATGDL